MTSSKRFIPKNKPKSWVVFIISILVALLVAVPIVFAGAYFHIESFEHIGNTLLILCILLFIPSWLVFPAGALKGKYRNLVARDWGEQLW